MPAACRSCSLAVRFFQKPDTILTSEISGTISIFFLRISLISMDGEHFSLFHMEIIPSLINQGIRFLFPFCIVGRYQFLQTQRPKVVMEESPEI